MKGRVEDNHALLAISILIPNSPELQIEFVVDTGFIGFLTLPEAAVEALGLRFVRRLVANLADDSTIHLRVYSATILWHGKERVVEVLATGRRPLLGTLLLAGSKLNAHFVEWGPLSIDGFPALAG